MKNLLKIFTVIFLGIFMSACASIDIPQEKEISSASVSGILDTALTEPVEFDTENILVSIPINLVDSAIFDTDSLYEDYFIMIHKDTDYIDYYIKESSYDQFITAFSRDLLLYIEALPQTYTYIDSVTYTKDFKQIEVFLNQSQFGDSNRIVLYSSFSPIKIYQIFNECGSRNSDILVKVSDNISGDLIDSLYY